MAKELWESSSGAIEAARAIGADQDDLAFLLNLDILLVVAVVDFSLKN